MIHVLVAEDNYDLRTIFTRVFARQAFDVHAVEDGEQVLTYLQNDLPDVIILDLNMPKVSGLDVLRQVRQDPRMRDIKIIVVTGNHMANYEPETELADMLLIKPIDVFTLTHFVERLTKQPLEQHEP